MLRTDARVTTSRKRIESLDRITLFKPLPNSLRDRLASQLDAVDVAVGDTVIHQGEYGDEFYVVDTGELDVFVARQYVRSLGPDDFFGELALLADSPRTATVVATTDCRLWTLPRNAFLTILSGFPATGHAIEAASGQRTVHTPSPADQAAVLANVPLFAGLPLEIIEGVVDSARLCTHEETSEIFREGEAAGDAYFVVSGRVEMMQGDSVIRTLGERVVFGERGALRPGSARSVTATAAPGTVLMRLPADRLRTALTP